ncbi:hypothetical protein OV450_8274 [Actinobacteria bacterium OV450]|nr:hypothetical protein OV450_8274 [Actinobacteria bacterium OV450]
MLVALTPSSTTRLARERRSRASPVPAGSLQQNPCGQRSVERSCSCCCGMSSCGRRPPRTPWRGRRPAPRLPAGSLGQDGWELINPTAEGKPEGNLRVEHGGFFAVGRLRLEARAIGPGMCDADGVLHDPQRGFRRRCRIRDCVTCRMECRELPSIECVLLGPLTRLVRPDELRKDAIDLDDDDVRSEVGLTQNPYFDSPVDPVAVDSCRNGNGVCAEARRRHRFSHDDNE